MMRKKYNLIKLLRNGFLYIFIGNILNKTILFISSSFVARFVTKTEFAYFSYADNIYNYINLLSGAGVALALVKYSSANEDDSVDKGLLKFSLFVSTIANILITIAVISIFFLIGIPYENAKFYIFILILYPTINYGLQVFQSYLRAKQYVKQFAISNIIQSVSIMLLSILLAYSIGVKGVIFARYIGTFIASIYVLNIVHKRLVSTKEKMLDKENSIAFIKMSFALMIANFFSSVMPINENYLVNNLILDTNVISNFKVAGMLPSHLSLITTSICIFYFPIVSKIKDEKKAFKQIIKVQALNFFLVTTTVFVGMITSKWFITTIYGNKYSDAVSLSYILWIMRGLNAAFRILPMNMLPALGKTGFNSFLAIVSCFAHVILDYIFIKNIGINGVAYAAIIVYTITAILYWWYTYKVCYKNNNNRR